MSPITFLEIAESLIFNKSNLGSVAYSDLMTFEYFCSATFLATRPRAIALSISKSVICYLSKPILHEKSFIATERKLSVRVVNEIFPDFLKIKKVDQRPHKKNSFN